MEELFDPLRKKNVAYTPEEAVRQWFISLLSEQMQVPKGLMMSEVQMEFGQETVSLGNRSRKKMFRADIVVYDREAKPLMIVECKRPEVRITDFTLRQVLRYYMVLPVRFIVMTNGKSTYIGKKTEEGFRFINDFPSYNEMLEV